MSIGFTYIWKVSTWKQIQFKIVIDNQIRRTHDFGVLQIDHNGCKLDNLLDRVDVDLPVAGRLEIYNTDRIVSVRMGFVARLLDGVQAEEVFDTLLLQVN